MFFGNFFDTEKSVEENKQESDKAKHNRDVLMGVTAAVTLVTAVITAGLAVRKVVKEVM